MHEFLRATRQKAMIVAALFCAVIVVPIGRRAEGQTSPYRSQIEAATLVAVPYGDNRSQDSGQVDGTGNNVAQASDKVMDMPITVGPLALGSISADVRSAVAAGTFKMYSSLSVTGDPSNPLGGLGFAAGVSGSAFDYIRITRAPAGGSVALSAVFNPANTQTVVVGSGQSWYADLSITVGIFKYPAGGGAPTMAGNYNRMFSSGSAEGIAGSNSGPARIPVQVGDVLEVDASENSNTRVSAPDGETATVMADFGHTTHVYVWPAAPGIACTSVSGHDYTPIPGDANVDGQVDFSDLLLLAQNYGNTNATWEQGDFNGDGKVDFSDLLILAQNYGQPPAAAELARLGPAFEADVQRAFAEIPEPSSSFPLTLAAAGLLPRRGRRMPANDRGVAPQPVRRAFAFQPRSSFPNCWACSLVQRISASTTSLGKNVEWQVIRTR